MQAMPSFDTLTVLVLLSAFFTAGAFAQEQSVQTAVTLWQFGQGRLLEAHVTLPLQPLGTLGDGSATTYLYQALNDATVTTTNAAGLFTTQTIAKPTPRTIVASASGWVDQFGFNNDIACRFVNSVVGACFQGTTTIPINTGKPTPEVILIAALTSAPTPVPTSSQPTAQPAKQPPSVGAIVGGTIAGLLALFFGLAACIVFRRRRQQKQQEYENKFAARGYDPKPTDDNSNTAGKPLPFTVFAAGPQMELALGAKRHKRDYSGSSQSTAASASEIPTSDLVRMLAQRVESDQYGRAEPPPAYPATPRFRSDSVR